MIPGKLNKKTLIVLGIALFIFLFGICVFLYKKDPFRIFVPELDKYSEILSWCDNDETEPALSIKCQGLLLNIITSDDSVNCFDIVIITKDEELKNISTCEKGSTFSYTNDILEYKKLMPISIIFSYTKEGVLNNYSLENISLTKLDDTYVQNIVNEDIVKLTKQTVLSGEYPKGEFFCPNVADLASIIADDVLLARYDEMISSVKKEYQWLISSSINTKFTDYSAKEIYACFYYPEICKTTYSQKIKDIINGFPHLTNININSIEWEREPSELDNDRAAYISYLYDNLNSIEDSNISYINETTPYNTFKIILKSEEIDENLFCSMYRIYEIASRYNDTYSEDQIFIRNEIFHNITKTDSQNCSYAIQNETDKYGLYLANHLKSSSYSSICTNLTLLVK